MTRRLHMPAYSTSKITDEGLFSANINVKAETGQPVRISRKIDFLVSCYRENCVFMKLGAAFSM